MRIRYGYKMSFRTAQPTPMLLLLDLHPDRAADVLEESPFHVTPDIEVSCHIDHFGNRARRLVAPAGAITISQGGVIADSGQPEPTVEGAVQHEVADLPASTLIYLNGSRYCETDELGDFAWSRFGSIRGGGARVQAICDFVHERIHFDYADASATRTAREALEEGKGVCRDFTHLAIALCRCLNIPARYVNGYLGDIGVPALPYPMDFSAWFEAYLGGRWWTLDARHNVPRIGRITVSRGRDAADVALCHSFGAHLLTEFSVWTEEAPDSRGANRSESAATAGAAGDVA